MDFININERVQGIIRISKGVARAYGHGCYAPAHILFALTHKEAVLHLFLESMEKVRRPISKMIISGELTSGQTVVIDKDNNEEITWGVKQ